MRIAAASGSGMRLGHRERHRRRRDRELGVAAERAARDRDDARADERGVDAVAHGLDGAEHLHARGCTAQGPAPSRYRPWMPSMSLKLSVTASTCTSTSPGPGVGRVDVLEPQHVARRAVLDRSPGAHGADLRGGVERERQVRQAAHVAGVRAHHRLAELVVRVAREQLLERDARLEPGQRGTDAEVDAEARARRAARCSRWMSKYSGSANARSSWLAAPVMRITRESAGMVTPWRVTSCSTQRPW